MPERVKYLDVFQEGPGDSLSPKVQIEINGVTIGPGATFKKGAAIGGVDFFLYKYRDISVEKQADGIWKIDGFFR